MFPRPRPRPRPGCNCERRPEQGPQIVPRSGYLRSHLRHLREAAAIIVQPSRGPAACSGYAARSGDAARAEARAAVVGRSRRRGRYRSCSTNCRYGPIGAREGGDRRADGFVLPRHGEGDAGALTRVASAWCVAVEATDIIHGGRRALRVLSCSRANRMRRARTALCSVVSNNAKTSGSAAFAASRPPILQGLEVSYVTTAVVDGGCFISCSCRVACPSVVRSTVTVKVQVG